GHPNPLRGEYVMNGGNPGSSIDPAQVDAYPVGTLPDANWRGYAFDFQNNASPNGVIEYKSNTFNGVLKGKILVVRYSQHDDIITLTPGGSANDIIGSTEGISIRGFSGFIDPLDLTEDVSKGNIYVSEYGGNGKIVLLRADTTTSNNSNTDSINVLADAVVRGKTYGNVNYGSDTSLAVKGTSAVGDLTRLSYLKFPLNNSISNVTYAKLRLYGRNTEDATTINVSVFGVNDDSWIENRITYNNAPAGSSPALSSAGINGVAKYYEFDVTNFVQAQSTGDKIAGFLLKDIANSSKKAGFNSKENPQNKPQLVIVANNDTIILGGGSSTAALTAAPSPTPTRAARFSSSPSLSLPEMYSALFSMQEAHESKHNFEKPKLYPVPAHNKLNIEFPGKYQGIFTIEIVDLVGRTYKIGSPRLKPGGSNMEVNISKLSLNPGVYFLRIRSDAGKTEMIKMIIE
ncbi:MAG: DNRLRE domain-containing protein, partial [Ginsengibacter sp.]